MPPTVISLPITTPEATEILAAPDTGSSVRATPFFIGASTVVFPFASTETAARSLDVIAHNIATLGAADRAIVHRVDALKFLEKLGDDRFDVAFADPPYDKGLATAVAEQWLAKPFARVIGIEHRRDETLPGAPDTRRYGGTSLSFYYVSADD